MNQVEAYHSLKEKLSGDLFTENVQRVIYATDASSYREIPEAVCKPKSKDDIREIINFARENGTSIIPRAAGTSLAGQVVGSGIVVDISKYMTQILEFNKDERWVWVEPRITSYNVCYTKLLRFRSRLLVRQVKCRLLSE